MTAVSSFAKMPRPQCTDTFLGPPAQVLAQVRSLDTILFLVGIVAIALGLSENWIMVFNMELG